MTNVQMDRELDALVAEKVMGLDVRKDDGGYSAYQLNNTIYMMIAPYSTDIAAAWEVVTKMDKTACDVSLEKSGLNWTATFAAVSETALTPERAICLAALKFMGHDSSDPHQSTKR
jgi:hypothetical protein